MSRKSIPFFLCSLALLSTIVNAETLNQHVVVAPQCLMKSMHGSYKTITSTTSFSLIEVDNAGIDALIEAKQIRQTPPCGGFMDVTEDWNAFKVKNISPAENAKTFLNRYTKHALKKAAAPSSYRIQYEKQVNQLLTQLNPQAMWDNLTTLSSFQDRYANSDYGVKAAEWIKTQVETFAKNNNRDDVTVYLIETGHNYKQASVIAKIGNSSGPGVVVGGHMDTLSGSFSKKPGADDDGSGSVTVLEAARVVLSSGMHFKYPIYFVWYSAEEEGLVGSGYVVSDFKKKNIPVNAVIHFDMTGYAYQNDPTMWLMRDYVNMDLVAYLEKLITTYVKQSVKYSACGYACSDHATWTQNGYPAAIAAEAAYENTNPVLHTSRDTIDRLSLTHMTDYAKLATAFAVELAEPV